MKFKIKLLVWGLLISLHSVAQNIASSPFFEGKKLYGYVEKYVALGEHRTGTTTDFATSEWLGNELKSYGYEVNYLEFPLRQFFLEKAQVIIKNKPIIEAFPLWYVSDSIQLNVEGVLTDQVSELSLVKEKVVLLNFSADQAGQAGKNRLKQLNDLIAAKAKAIIIYAENEAGEIIAFNAPKAAKPWAIPIVVVSPKDAKGLQNQIGKKLKVAISGTFKNVNARNVYGKIGTGGHYVVISTPISGWFTCGGERGPGVAIWLALAQWVASQKLPYTFIFTGNSGHELGGWGAKAFLENEAPPIDKTKLWLHLGAGVATLNWKSSPKGLVKENTVDITRSFFYSQSVKESFDYAFKNIGGKKWEVKERVGGELAYVVDKGYPHVVGISHAHPFFHMKNDDASKTSPEILEEAGIAFKDLIWANSQPVTLKRLTNNPIITHEMLGQDGENINGPSLIKAPDWLPNKLGKYYLYFAHHQGLYIRLAYSDDIKGPWKIYQPGTLKTVDCRCKDGAGKPSNPENKGEVYLSKAHIASPDVHIDPISKKLVMYFHCPLNNQGKKGQYTLRAVSDDGIHFKADTTVLGESYFRVFEWKNNHYAIARAGDFYRSKDGGLTFEAGPNPFNKIQTKQNHLRHCATKVVGDELWVFYSKIGDKPESLLLSKIKLTDNWNDWTPTFPITIAEPTTDYEGANLPLTVSKPGSFHGLTRELRDPAFYEENGKWYLLYSVGGESGIGIGEIQLLDAQNQSGN